MNQGTRCVVALLALVATLQAPHAVADGTPPTAAGAGQIDLSLRTYAEDLLIDELPARRLHGHQTEWPPKSTYIVQSGFAKNAVVSPQLYVTDASARYSGPSLNGGRFEINVPVHVL